MKSVALPKKPSRMNNLFERVEKSGALQATVADQILLAMRIANVTKRSLAKRLGEDLAYVERVLQGIDLHLSVVERIAHALGHNVQINLAPKGAPSKQGNRYRRNS